jgi:hypothetical protein
VKWFDLRDASKVPPKTASGLIVWTSPFIKQEAHFLSTFDPFRHFPHEVTEDTLSREVCGEQQAPTAETICGLANCFSPVLLKNQMVQRSHEQNSVEWRGWHCVQISCVSHHKLYLSEQMRGREPLLASFQESC